MQMSCNQGFAICNVLGNKGLRHSEKRAERGCATRGVIHKIFHCDQLKKI